MGDTPKVVKIACPGCETQFRLKPKKGHLPAGPVPCPKCGESIPVVEENIRRDGAKKPQALPQAQVFERSSKKSGRATHTGSPADTPHRSDVVAADEARTQESSTDETSGNTAFDHIAVAPGLSNSNPKSTFLGMGSALQAVNGPSSDKPKGLRGDKTAVVDGEVLDKMRSESSVVEDDEVEDDSEAEVGRNDTPHRDSSDKNVFDRETSENQVVGPQKLDQKNENSPKPPPAPPGQDAPGQDAPGHLVLGKINIKKKLKRSLKKKSNKSQAGVRSPSKPVFSDDTSTSDSKPSLSSLLKKARQKKDKFNLPQPAAHGDKDTSLEEATSKNFDRALDDLADETARSIENAQPDTAPPEFDSGDSSMIELLQRRVAENQQPGAASERRGSGYIRLPTAEIQDVLGQGTYRLRVEDIVYEPIDQQGLTELVKRGVLLGAEEIAEPDGDWMPIADHPVFVKLRRKMAHEAHHLLEKYKPDGGSELPGRKAELPGRKAELPGRKAELPGRKAELPSPSSDTLEEIPELEAEIEEEAKQAAKSLFSDVDSGLDETVETGPPPMAAKPAPGKPPPSDDPSIELDYDALGVEEDDVEVEQPDTTAKTGSVAARGSSMRTWLPLVVAAAVVVVLAGVALTPFGRAYLEGALGDTFADKATVDESNTAAKDTPKQAAKTKKAVAQASTVVGEALDIDPSETTLQETVADEFIQSGDFAGASRVMGVLWQQRRDDPEFAADFADTLIQAGHFERARQIAIDGLQMTTDSGDFAQIFTRAVEKNPDLGAFDVVDISSKLADAASVTSDDKRVTVNLSRDGAPTFRFKPSQKGWENGWRTSIASYRLCQILVCNFHIPRTRPARIDKATFDALTENGTAENNNVESANQLDWTSEDGKKYVYGALQDPVQKPARFPIEDIDIWRSWLLPGSDDDMANTSATQALSELEGHPQGFFEPLADHLGQTSLQQLAAQLSSVLVFDFLTNNWSRFQSGDDNWGTHLHLADGHLVSLHNGNAFQPRASTRIKGRFSWTSRFSKDTIASLRLMTPELVSEKLFPNTTPDEKARLDVFWSQRDAVLERIDQLESTHGSKQTLAFE
jgi:hypothetical protein